MKSDVMYDHIHFGAGKLGLGLIVPLSKNACNKVLILNSTRNKKSKPFYNLLKKTKTYRLEPEGKQITVDGIHLFSKHVNTKFLQNVLTSSSIRMITTAVTE